MAARKGMTKKTRFEVFKRDSFTCQYCGKAAPDVVLRVDHIHPVSKGGEDDVMNLITSCQDCNAGKSDRVLTDDTVITKQRAQLAELNERREQLEMMLNWRDGLKKIGEESIDVIATSWKEHVPGFSLNDTGLREAKKYLKRFGLPAVLDAMETAAAQYLKFDSDGAPLPESIEIAWHKVGGICAMSAMPENERQLYYIRGILRNRFSYINFEDAMRLLRTASSWGLDTAYLKRLAIECRNWTQWVDWMEEAITDQGGKGDL